MDDVTTMAPGASGISESAASEVFVVELAEYSGPLDLLLTLIRDEQIDIYDIPIARIAEQFLARISSLKLDEAADNLEMAARRVRMQAQTLLPRRAGHVLVDDPRAELVRRLLEYQQVREVVDVLERRSEERRGKFARAYSQQTVQIPLPGKLSLSLPELLSAVDRVLRLAKKPHIHDVVPRALDVDGAIGIVRALLAIRARAQWKDILPKRAEPWEVLSLLLALLELAKRGELRLVQSHAFAAFEITRDPSSEAA
jgi:segregation and condensation protein A